jgi:transposase
MQTITTIGLDIAKASSRFTALMPPAYVKPYVKRLKNDATDAEARARAITNSEAVLCSNYSGL